MKQFIATPKFRAILITIVILLTVLFVLGILQFGWGWTGFPTKTLWDLMELLIVPVVIALGALWFNREQLNREQWLAREHEEERLLQNYFDKITDLLLEKNLRGSDEGSEVRSIARVRTYTALRAVNKIRKTNIMWFLIQARLIGETTVAGAGVELETEQRRNIVNLKGAPLSETDLPYADLRGADLRFVHFRHANLAHARLENAILFGTDLRGANLNMAKLEGADLRNAKYDSATQWPDDFDPEQVGAVRVEEGSR